MRRVQFNYLYLLNIFFTVTINTTKSFRKKVIAADWQGIYALI